MHKAHKTYKKMHEAHKKCTRHTKTEYKQKIKAVIKIHESVKQIQSTIQVS